MGQITKNVRSRDQFKKYETETRSLRDQNRDCQQKTETETETETDTLKIGLESGKFVNFINFIYHQIVNKFYKFITSNFPLFWRPPCITKL